MPWTNHFDTRTLINYPYIIIDDNQESILKTRAMASGFHKLSHVGSADNYDDGINLILEFRPKLVFLEISPENQKSNLSLQLISELYRYLKVVPKIIITSANKELAYEALKYEVSDFLPKPLQIGDFRKSLLKLERNDENPSSSIILPMVMEAPANDVAPLEINKRDSEEAGEIKEMPEKSERVDLAPHPARDEKPLIICVKSYGDYRFINASDICYLQADNNSTDIHLNNGEMITAFKTLKHFENILVSPFVRIHNSYIVNIDYVSRIHMGNAVCYIKNTTTKLPFSKSYKENIDSILTGITEGNYLEI